MRAIPLTRGMQTIVDDQDYAHLSEHNWYAISCNGCFYAGRSPGTILMHRQIMGCPEGLVVDHINGNPLDNRRSNLRLATQSQNMANQRPQQGRTSAYKGVFWDKARTKWRAAIQVNGKSILIGRYDAELEAASAYDSAALHYFGEFAKPNLPGAIPLAPERNERRQRRSYANTSSVYKGVSWRKDRSRWQAVIRVDGKTKHIGTFVREEDAARAYDAAARRHFGKHAVTNF